MGVEGGDREVKGMQGLFLRAPLRFTLDSRTPVTLLHFPVSLVVVVFFPFFWRWGGA